MRKSVVEYLGAGAAIAGAGIWLASVPAVAYAETDAADTSSSDAEAVSHDTESDSEHVEDISPTDDDGPNVDDPASPSSSEETETVDPEEPEPETPSTTDEQPDSVTDGDAEPGAAGAPEPTDAEAPAPDAEDVPASRPRGNRIPLSEQDDDPGHRPPSSADTVDRPTQDVPVPEEPSNGLHEVQVTESEPAVAEAASVSIPAADEDEPVPDAIGSTASATAPNPAVTLLAGVLTFLGLNTPEAPDNPLGAFVWGLFRRVETALGVVPEPGRPTVGTPTAEGVVTGTVGFDTAAGLPLTYTVSADPAQGTVSVNPDGTFTFTPTAAARLAAGAPGAFTEASIIVTATNGLAATSTVVTVPIEPYEMGSVIATVPVGSFPAGPVLNADGTKIYIPNIQDDTVSVIDTATNTVIGAPIAVGDRPTGLVLSLDEKYLYVTSSVTGSVSVVETATGTTVASIPLGAATSPDLLAIGPDGRYVYVPVSTSVGGGVSVIDTTTNTVLGTITTNGRVSAGVVVVTNALGTFVYVTDSLGVTVIDTAVNITRPPVTFDGVPHLIAASPDGTRVYTADLFDGTVTVIDTFTNTVIETVTVGDNGLGGVAVSPDGKFVYVTDYAGAELIVIDASTNTVVDEPIPAGEAPTFVTVSNDGSLAYVSDAMGAVLVIYTGNWVTTEIAV